MNLSYFPQINFFLKAGKMHSTPNFYNYPPCAYLLFQKICHIPNPHPTLEPSFVLSIFNFIVEGRTGPSNFEEFSTGLESSSPPQKQSLIWKFLEPKSNQVFNCKCLLFGILVTFSMVSFYASMPPGKVLCKAKQLIAKYVNISDDWLELLGRPY